MISLIFHSIQILTSIENHTAQSADLQSMTLPNYTVSLSMEMRLRMMHSSSLEHSYFLENV